MGDSLAPSIEGRTRLGDRQARENRARQRAIPSRRKKLRALDAMLQARRLECPAGLEHISYTHPFLHRPLVEFMLTIPPPVVCRPGEPRRLMRRAFREMLPEPVLRRRSKGNYGGMFAASLRPLAFELLKDVAGMHLVEGGYVDPASVRNRLGRLVQGLECNEPQLRCLILLEFWLRERVSPSCLAAEPAAMLA